METQLLILCASMMAKGGILLGSAGLQIEANVFLGSECFSNEEMDLASLGPLRKTAKHYSLLSWKGEVIALCAVMPSQEYSTIEHLGE